MACYQLHIMPIYAPKTKFIDLFLDSLTPKQSILHRPKAFVITKFQYNTSNNYCRCWAFDRMHNLRRRIGRLFVLFDPVILTFWPNINCWARYRDGLPSAWVINNNIQIWRHPWPLHGESYYKAVKNSKSTLKCIKRRNSNQYNYKYMYYLHHRQ